MAIRRIEESSAHVALFDTRSGGLVTPKRSFAAAAQGRELRAFARAPDRFRHRLRRNERAMARSHRQTNSGSSQRQLRVGELIRHALAEMLTRGDVHDAVIEGHLITVPEVRMSPDLRLATIYVMPLGGRDAKDVVEALDRNKKFLRGEIAHRVNLKFAPEIRFRIDERFDEAERIEKLLRTPAVQRDLDKTDEES
jgi:ribosome-binding factor A